MSHISQFREVYKLRSIEHDDHECTDNHQQPEDQVDKCFRRMFMRKKDTEEEHCN